ncbi:MAG: four helix bundle protein [Clostridia bacterium]|nr:four helix bundle protein [Clostridia bacterium]
MEKTIEEKSFDFAIRIVKLKDYLITERKEFDLSRQILRSGTSIGANVSEAQQAQSQADFLNKINIALKEAAETKYWLRLLKSTNKLTEKETESILSECIEIEKILYSIVRTTKNKLDK